MPRLLDRFDPSPLPHWQRHVVGAAAMVRAEEGLRLLTLPDRGRGYRNSQLSDARAPGQPFCWQPPLRLTVRARFSQPQGALHGTAGFGWWNEPFMGDVARLLRVGPQALWFFLASPPNNLALTAGWPGHGLFAQSLDLGHWPPPLLGAGLVAMKLPPLLRLGRHLAPRLAQAAEAPLPAVDLSVWHDFAITWHPHGAEFFIDGRSVHRAAQPPRGPLSLILWMDNQWASIELRAGRLALAQPQWLELAEVRVEALAG